MDEHQIPVVQTAGLTKVFKDFWRRDRVAAVNDLNIEVRRGEVFGLLGPNGSGKSTTIKMLLGLLYPTRGRIAIFGHPPTDVAVKSRIGFLPEESYLYRYLNARETLDLYGRLFKLPAEHRADRIEKLLDMVGLGNEGKRRVGEYSKGMARRIGLAQALINDPEFLILDEPTAGMDPLGMRQIKNVIRELADRGKTILLSSHLLADVEDVCDRVCILYGGQQRAEGPIDELLRQDDRTQITTDRLSDATIERVRQVIRESEHKDIIQVAPPTDRLEAVFLRTVEQAQAANVATAGAKTGGDLPDFIGTEEPADVIGSLVSAADREIHSVQHTPLHAPQSTPADDSRKQLLASLTEQKAPPPAASDAKPQDPADEPPSRKPAADQSVIDSLLKRGKEDDGG